MALQLKLMSLDYTDYIESISLQVHAEGILQSSLPSISMVINLSTVVDESINPPNKVLFGMGNKNITLNIDKITRGKGTTEVRTSRLPISIFEDRIKGLFALKSNWTSFINSYNLKVDGNIIRLNRNIYINKDEDILTGMTATTEKQAMIDHTLPTPWETLEYISRGGNVIRQLQTAQEYADDPKPNVAQYGINYDDVISEDEVTSGVDTASVVTSKLQEKRTGTKIEFRSTGSWAQTFRTTRLLICEQGNAYGLVIISGTGKTLKSKLYMSDGSVHEVDGIVAGITPDYYYRCYTPNETQWVMEIDSLSDDSALATTLAATMIADVSHYITEHLATHGETVRIRQTQVNNYTPTDIILFGRPFTIATSLVLGVAYYKDASNNSVMALIITSADRFSSGAGSDCWLLSSFQSGAQAFVRYGSLNGCTDVKINYNGFIPAGTDEVINHSFSSSGATGSFYPMTASRISRDCWIAYRSDTTPHICTGSTSGPSIESPIIWTERPEDDSIVQCIIGGFTTVAGFNGSQFYLKHYLDNNKFTTTDVTMQKAYVRVIMTPIATAMIFGDGNANETRTIVLEGSAIPENTYDLKAIKITTGNKGENSELRMPFILQGANQAWPLIPTNKTRLSVRTSALTVRRYGSESIKMNASTVGYAYGSINSSYGNYLKPHHKYYIACKIKAPSGITATKAMFGWEQPTSSNTPVVRVDLNNINSTNTWETFSAIVDFNSDVSKYMGSTCGMFTEGAGADWYFKDPQICDLTELYGAGNEPDATWCNDNLPIEENLLYNYSLQNTGSGDWSFSNASYNNEWITRRYPVDNENITLPQIGCPILYQRTEKAPVFNIKCNTTSGWERLYIPIQVEPGHLYSLFINYKVNSTYNTLVGYDSVPIQILNSIPTDGGNQTNQVAKIGLLKTRTENYSEDYVFFSTETATTYYICLNMGYANGGQTLDIDFGNFSLLQDGMDITPLELRDMTKWVNSLPSATTVSELSILEEGIILGYDYKYDGGSDLAVDILLLGKDPKPWKDSTLKTI